MADEQPIIHLYSPPWQHCPQVIACNRAGWRVLRQLADGWAANPVEVQTADGEGYPLCLLVTDAPERLPDPYTAESCPSDPERDAWFARQVRGLLGLDPETGLPLAETEGDK